MHTPTRLVIVLLAAVGSSACERAPDGAKSQDGSTSAAAPPRDDAIVTRCARCHLLPPPDALPRDVWPAVVADMARVPVPDGQLPLSAADLEIALAHYTGLAPETLPPVAAAATHPAGPRFETIELVPPGLEQLRLPAVTSVRVTPFTDARRPDILATELRARTLLHVAAWAPAGERVLAPLLFDLAYPAHVEVLGAEGVGPPDFAIAALGGMAPTNDRIGQVKLVERGERGRATTSSVATDLGRVAHVSAGDLDGDGDEDLVASVFGWRGPGELLLLERRDEDASPSFRPHVLDERDGFVRAETTDLDGDGRLDIVALLAQEHEELMAFVNLGELRFIATTLYRAPHPSWGFSSLELVDLDADGDLDVLTANGDSLDYKALRPYHGVQWFENTGVLQFHPHAVAALHGCARAVAADMDGDGDIDIVASSFMPLLRPETMAAGDLDSLVWIERRPEGWRKWRIEAHSCIHPTLAVADVTGDGRLDVVVGNYVWIDEKTGPLQRAPYVTVFAGR